MSVYVRNKTLAWGGMTKGTMWILIITALLFGVQTLVVAETWIINQGSPYFSWFALYTGHVLQDHYYWQVVTYMFLHGSVGHLFGNMVFLWIVGCMLEMGLGRVKYVGLYIIGGLMAVWGYWLVYMDSTMPLVGASGSIAGLMGAYAVLFKKKKVKIFYWA